MSFEQLGLAAPLLQAVAEQGYLTPTPIQQRTIPLILEGRDVLAGAQTGTGKTASFTLPLLQLLAESETKPQKPRKVRALILAPTRELAAQVYDSVRAYGKHLPLFAEVIVGGVSINGQIRSLQRGCDIVVATPGRLLDHLLQRHVDLSHIEMLVLDEADRMLDMGFLPDIRRIIGHLPKKKQSLLFSATFPEEIKGLAKQLLHEPAEVSVAPRNKTADNIKELCYGIGKEYKRELLSYMIGSNNWKQVLIFVRTKHGADRLEKQLVKDGIRTAALHGDKSQGARTRALEQFKAGQVAALVATDIAARGLDIDDLPHVINFDLPQVPEDYIHRIGRTGRASANGEAISLVCPEEAYQLAQIEKLLGRELPRVADTGYEPVSLKVVDKPSSKAPKNPSGKKDYRHHQKTPARAGGKPAGKSAGKPQRRAPGK